MKDIEILEQWSESQVQYLLICILSFYLFQKKYFWQINLKSSKKSISNDDCQHLVAKYLHIAGCGGL